MPCAMSNRKPEMIQLWNLHTQQAVLCIFTLFIFFPYRFPILLTCFGIFLSFSLTRDPGRYPLNRSTVDRDWPLSFYRCPLLPPPAPRVAYKSTLTNSWNHLKTVNKMVWIIIFDISLLWDVVKKSQYFPPCRYGENNLCVEHWVFCE